MILELQPATDDHVDAFALVYGASLAARHPMSERVRDGAALHGYCRTLVVEHEAWVGIIDARPVACLALGTDWIRHLHVHPDRTGLGIGTRLIELAQYRRNTGLRMYVDAEADGARRFLERHGFVAAGEDLDPASGLARITYDWRPRP